MNQFTTHRLHYYEEVLRLVEANGNNFVAQQILSFRHLPEGWHYREGRGATERAITTALKINYLLAVHGASTVEVFPEVDGGILVSGYNGDHTLDVLCNEDGRIHLLHEIKDEVRHEQDGVALEELIQYLRRLSWRAKGSPWRLLKSSDFSIQDISVEKRGDLRVLLSRIHPRTVVFQSSIQNAPNPLATPNADTYITSTTLPFQDIPLYSGG